MNWLARPEAGVIVEGVGAVILVFTLSYVARQIQLQRRDLEFRIYQQINDRYSDLLWRAVEDPDLDLVWRPLTKVQRRWIDAHSTDRAASEGDELPQVGPWPTWSALSCTEAEMLEPPPFDLAVERKLYRFIRSVLELCEQAHFAKARESIQPETWEKFQSVLRQWSESRYFNQVFTESRSRLTENFNEVVDEILLAHPPRKC